MTHQEKCALLRNVVTAIRTTAIQADKAIDAYAGFNRDISEIEAENRVLALFKEFQDSITNAMFVMTHD